MYFRPMSNAVAGFLIFKLFTNLVPTVLMFIVIYSFPNWSGKVKRIEIHENDITISSMNSVEEDDADIDVINKTNTNCVYGLSEKSNRRSAAVTDVNRSKDGLLNRDR